MEDPNHKSQDLHQRQIMNFFNKQVYKRSVNSLRSIA